MNYPLISEYIEAIKSAEDNFEELSYLRLVLGDDGLPVMTSGNFAVVFKMMDERDGKLYAVKCFTKEQEGRAEAYQQITEELKDVSSPYLTSVRYLDKELFVDTDQTNETEFPVLLMDWVEGKTLDKYLRENLDDKYALEMLAYRFSQLAQWLIPQPFAHGDLKPDNILVREDGTLVLVDYDGMFVPAMKGQKARELGSPDFRHPLRTENDFDEHIDDFPLVSILLSLKAISLNKGLLDEYCTSNHLLFSEKDYRNVYESIVFKKIVSFYDIEIKKLTVAFLYHILNSVKARYPIMVTLNSGYSPEITSKYKDKYYSKPNLFIDEYGVEYTLDRKVLLRWRDILKEEVDFPSSYSVCEGTEVICDDAFMFCKNLATIYLPKSLKYIGKSVFVGTKLSSISCDSSMFVVDNNILFSYDKRILYYYPEDRKDTYYEVPEQVKHIVKGCFSTATYLWVICLKHIRYNFDDLAFISKYISIPKGTKKYIHVDYNTYGPPGEKYPDIVETRNNIFEGDLIVDDGVVYSLDKTILYRFPYWLDREEYCIDEKCKIIEEAAFDDNTEIDEWGQHIQFNKLKTLFLPNGLEQIKDYAFVGCGHIENLTIPLSVKTIGNYVFGQCVNLITLTFLSKIDIITQKSFYIGKTMPGDLVNPSVPYVIMGYKKCEVDIVICPKGTNDYYEGLLDNKNSQILTLNKDEMEIKSQKRGRTSANDIFTLSELKLFLSVQMEEKLKDIVYEISGSNYPLENRFRVDFIKLKELMTGVFVVFDIRKLTNRFYGRQLLSGICYVTNDYRTKFVYNDISFASRESALDFVFRVYSDIMN